MRSACAAMIGLVVAWIVSLGGPPPPAAASGSGATALVSAACDATGTPTTTVYLPNITKTLGGPNGWVTPFVVQNVGTVSTTLEVSYYGFTDGSLIACRKISDLAPATSFADVPNDDADLADNSQYSVVVRSFGASIVAVVNEHQAQLDAGRAEAASYVGLSGGATTVYAPYVAKTSSGWITTFVIQNLGTATTSVTIGFKRADGTVAGTLARTVAPGRSAVVDPRFESAVADGVYAVTLSADQPIGVVVNDHNDAATNPTPSVFSYNGVAAPSGSTAYVPYIARNTDGVGRSTTLHIQNAGSAAAAPILTLRSFGGAPTATVTGPSVPPGATWAFDPLSATGLTDGEWSATVAGGPFAVVAATLTTATALGYTSATVVGTTLYLPNLTRRLGGASGWTTPILLQSAGATGATLRWYRFADGALVHAQGLTGLAAGETRRIDPRDVPALADETQYAVVAEGTGGPIYALVVEMRSGADNVMAYEGFAASSIQTPTPTPTPVPTAAPGSVTRPATAQVTLTVVVPANTPADDIVWVSTGVLFGDGSDTGLTKVDATTWSGTVSAPQGSILRYRYYRQRDWSKEESYTLRDGGFHYREALVTGTTTIRDTIAKWEDLPATANATGTLRGTVRDTAGRPVMDLVVSAGPHQTTTRWDGTYRILAVPAGTDQVTVRAENGEYAAQTAAVAVPAGGSAAKDFTVTAVATARVTFRVNVPTDTPSGGVPRLFGDTPRLGLHVPYENSVAYTASIIDMTPSGGATWTYTATLGLGTVVQYLYTLGHWSLDQERDTFGWTGVTRSLTVSGDVTVDDTVAHWNGYGEVAVTLEATSPTSDTVYVATSDADGSKVVKMWPLGGSRWRYVMYVPQDRTLSYRYVRNGDYEIGIEKLAPDAELPGTFRQMAVARAAVSQTDTIASWRHQLRETLPAPVTLRSTGTVPARVSGRPFHTGIEFIDYWRPAWSPLVQPGVERVRSHNAAWAQIPAVAGILSLGDTPLVELGPNGFTAEELVSHIRAARLAGLKVMLRTMPYPVSGVDAGFALSHTNAWYDQLFDEVKAIYMHDAKLAQQQGVEGLMLGTFDFAVDDNDPTKVSYINGKWRSIVAAVRSVYTGVVTNSNFVDRSGYDWYGDLDYVGDIWWEKVGATSTSSYATMKANALDLLATKYKARYDRFGKPLLFSEIGFCSADGCGAQTYGVYAREIDDFKPAVDGVASDWQEQADAYEATVRAFAETTWVQGAYSFAYSYMDHDSKAFSIRGKTAEEVLKLLYQQINGP